MDTPAQYAELIKPFWSPPSWLFGPVWSVLYAIIVVTYGTVFYKAFTKHLPAGEAGIPWLVALPFALNLVFNFSCTYFQFGLKNNLLASADILLVLATLVWAILILRSSLSEAGLGWVTYANIPYLLWVSFATVLQLTITWMNWPARP